MVGTDGGHGVSLREAAKVWGYVGLNSFGGPAGQIALMHRELVEQRRWLSERRFLHALNYCMVLPGPEAQQLATYVGWLMHGRRGGLIAGTLFILPGFVVMLALSVMYALYGSVNWVAGLLFGLQAAVVVLVAEAFLRISRRTLRSGALIAIATVSFLAITFFRVLFPIIIVVAALVGWFGGGRATDQFPGEVAGHASTDEPEALLADDAVMSRTTQRRALRAGWIAAALWLVPMGILVLALGTASVFSQEAILFSQSALVTFGGAYAVLAYIAQEAVFRYEWITSRDMVTGLGLAETTPGPLILVVQFVGFLAAFNNPGDLPPLVAGLLGAVLAIWVTFVPCFMFIFFGAPYVERLRENVALRHALTAVGAAVAGVVLSLAVWFTVNTAFLEVVTERWGPIYVPVPSGIAWTSVAISAVAAVLVFRFKVGTLRVLAACAGLGVLTGLL
ncbi:MAG: chromate efflux transporter [Actinobacteria bacterium]|nr:chromate efflux transporter [Actinomycetota bacterium]